MSTLRGASPSRRHGMPLFWRVCIMNGAVFVVGTAILAVSPATVSSPVVVTEAVVLAVGLGVMIAANGLLLRSTLSPLDRLARRMERLDLLQPDERLPESGNGALTGLVVSFNAMVARLEAERESSSRLALAAQERERQRIAQELHDEVGQSLTAVVLGLKRAADVAPESLRDDLEQAREIARGSLDEVRRVARRLRPGVLDDLGLISALTALANDTAELTGATLSRSLDPDLPHLGSEVELVVYRIAQEALTNISRHAEASTVTVSLTRSTHSIGLHIMDDGRGLGGAAEGAGLRGMRERALLIDASLVVADRPHAGTEVRLTVPLPRSSTSP